LKTFRGGFNPLQPRLLHHCAWANRVAVCQQLEWDIWKNWYFKILQILQFEVCFQRSAKFQILSREGRGTSTFIHTFLSDKIRLKTISLDTCLQQFLFNNEHYSRYGCWSESDWSLSPSCIGLLLAMV